MKYIFTIAALFVFATTISAQNVFKDLKSLEKRADRYYNEMSYVTAIELYKQALAKPKKSGSSSIRIKIAKSYLKTGQSDEAEQYYRQAMSKGFKPGKRDSTQFARILISNNKYQEAKSWMVNVVDKESDPSGFEQYKSISQLPTLYRDSFSFSVKSIIYNSEYSDYSPVFYKNGIVFSSDRPSQKLVRQVNMQKEAGFSELYFFKERDSIQRPAQPLNLDFKSPLHKGPVIFYDNGNKMILTANSLKGKVSRLQMFTADWDEKNLEWKNFQPFPFNSDFYSVGHPAMSKDERSLYFVSDMPGGNGGSDIYISVLKDGEWSKPKNLREPINTEGNEMFPYISPSGKFYFSSDGHGGLGGMDIVFTNNSFQNEQEIINSGYPLNSSADDFGIILDNQEKSGYFSSNRKGGRGQDDIYKLYIKKVELKLKVADEIASASVTNPSVKLMDIELETEISPSAINAKDNIYKYSLKPHHQYRLAVQKEDYKGVEKDISTMEIDDDQLIEVKAILKRKFEYYVTLKIRDTETENIVENSTIQVLNLTNKDIDSIGVNTKGEADIKLDSEADYLIIAFKNNMSGQITVEKQNKKKVSSVRFITLNISEQKEEKVVLQVLDSLNTRFLQPEDMIIRDMVTGEEKKMTVSENGLLEFIVKSQWYYRVYYNNKEFYYDSLKKVSTGNLKFKTP
jgi:pentatricopeptide repeat protein